MDNIQIVNGMYEAFKRGDLPYIMERFGEVERSGVVADARKRAPWHLPLTGKKDVTKYFEALLGACEPVRIEWRDLAAAGDFVYATLQQEWKVRATGKLLVMRDGVHRFRLREGRVVEWRGFEDTALTCEALGL
jgi:ketosteroid isomerase-like protein